MKHLLCTLTLLLFNQHFMAQAVEKFEDSTGNLKIEWTGNRDAFAIQNGLLISDHVEPNSVFYLSTDLPARAEEWILNCSLAFNPSSVNYVDFYILSDTPDLPNTENAWYVRIGGTTDEVSLYRLKDGTPVKIIDGRDGLLNRSQNPVDIRVLQQEDSICLFVRGAADPGFYPEGKAYFAPDTLRHTGILLRQSSSSFFRKHFFGKFYTGPVIRDATPPVCKTGEIQAGQLELHLSEPCLLSSLLSVQNFVLNGSITPDTVEVNTGGTVCKLHFNGFIQANIQHALHVSGILDLNGNRMRDTLLTVLYHQGVSPGRFDVLMTELMADPEPAAGLPIAEYIELRNVSGKHLSLDSCTISDLVASNILRNIILKPDSVFCLYNIPSLNNSGDRIMLRNAAGHVIHEVNYDLSWYRNEHKSEGGYSLEMIDIGKPCLGKENWTASVHPDGGTPGQNNSVAATLMADTTAPKVVNMYALNDTLLIAELTESADNPDDLLCSLNGIMVKMKWLDKSGLVYRFVSPYQFQREKTDLLSVSGLKDCEGNMSREQVFSIRVPSIPERGMILFSELLFNPVPGGKDYIELFNPTNKIFDLSTIYIAGLGASGSIHSVFRISDSYDPFLPGKYLLLTEDTLLTCSLHNCSREGVYRQINKMPVMPDDAGSLAVMNIYAEKTDSIIYNASWHHPLLGNYEGVSLERIDFASAGRPGLWVSASSVSGYGTPGYVNSQFAGLHNSDKTLRLRQKWITPNPDGPPMLLDCIMPKPGYAVSIRIFNMDGHWIRDLVRNEIFGTKETVSWDGCDMNGQRASDGLYIIMVEGIHPDGEVLREKLSLAVTDPFR